jgi:hypothetical protein
MFTEQVGQLDALEGSVNSELLQVLKNVLGNCAQELTHRGPIVIDGEVDFEGPVEFTNSTDVTTNVGGSGLQMFWAKATAAWTDGVMPYVQCVKMTARTGSPTADVVTLYLPKTKARTPNVQIDDVLGYMPIDETTGMCSTGYLDDPIGTIKGFDDPDNIPAGWEMIAGSRMIYGYDASDPDFDEVGSTGGGATHTHDDHTGDGSLGGVGGVGDHESDLWTGWAGAETIPFTGTIAPYTESAYLSPGDGAIEYSGGGSGSVTVSTENYNCKLSTGKFVDSEDVIVVDDGHSHDLTYKYPFKLLPSFIPPTLKAHVIGLREAYTGLTFNGGITKTDVPGIQYTEFKVQWDQGELFEGVEVTGDHDHTLDMTDVADHLMMGATFHTVTMAEHSHGYSVTSASLADHRHSIPPGSGGHDMTLGHSTSSNYIPYAVYCWIKRVA